MKSSCAKNKYDVLTFLPIDQFGFHVLESWFEDAELQRRYSLPTQNWFDYVSNTPQVYAWMIYEADNPIGHLQLDVETDGTGTIGFLVNPKFRNQGYGRRILLRFFTRSEVSQLRKVTGTVEPDNLASIRCVLSAGFVLDRLEPDEEGFLHFAYIPHQDAAI